MQPRAPRAPRHRDKRAVPDSLEGEVEVETHIEPLQADTAAGLDAPNAMHAEIAAALTELVQPNGPLRNMHDVRVRKTEDGLVVNFHCRAEAGLTIEQVHRAVDALERRLRESPRDVHRAIGHVEPAGSDLPANKRLFRKINFPSKQNLAGMAFLSNI